MKWFARPGWHGVSPAVVALAVLALAGLALQLAQGWASVAGDWVWFLTFLLMPVVAVTDPRRQTTVIGLISTGAFVLLGVGGAVLMIWWALVDSAQADRPATFFTGLAVGVAAIAALSQVVAERQSRGKGR